MGGGLHKYHFLQFIKYFLLKKEILKKYLINTQNRVVEIALK